MKQPKIILQEDSIHKGHRADKFSINKFHDDLQINIMSRTDEKIVFEMIHIEAPLANALRRIMIAEIPTMAIHKVQVVQNTSVIPDEVLAHRIGLIPILADPLRFINKDDQDDYTDKNSIAFTLNAKCEKKPNVKSTDPIEQQYTNTTVYSSSLVWEPIGQQGEIFKQQPIRAVHNNIIIAKLRENQEISLRLICEKGTGKQHAKWSPVCTAFYKLMPSITIKHPIKGDRANKLKDICPMKVFGVQGNQATVVKQQACTSCRECIRDVHGMKDDIELAKIEDHFICIVHIVIIVSIESVGQYRAQDIMIQAIDILRKKAQLYIKE